MVICVRIEYSTELVHLVTSEPMHIAVKSSVVRTVSSHSLLLLLLAGGPTVLHLKTRRLDLTPLSCVSLLEDYWPSSLSWTGHYTHVLIAASTLLKTVKTPCHPIGWKTNADRNVKLDLLG